MTTDHVQTIALKDLQLSPTNPRKTFFQDALKELASSIAENGVIQPIVVRPLTSTTFEVVVGERRTRASRLAGKDTIPALVRELDEATVLELQFIENDQREAVAPIEEADALDVLIEKHGRDPKDLAAKIGRPVSYIHRRRLLCQLIPELRELVKASRIPLGGGEALGQLPENMQRELANTRLKQDRVDHEGNLLSWSTKSVLHAIKFITRKLAHASWELDEQLGDLPACQGCPSRSGAQPGLPGLPADVNEEERCLDQSCWATKLTAKIEQLREQREQEGMRIWTEKHSEERAKNHNAFTTCSSTCWADPKRRTYEELIPKAPRYVSIEAQSGAVLERHYFSRSDIHSTLEREHHEIYLKLTNQVSKKEVEKRKAEREELEQRTRACVAWAGEQKPTRAMLALLARATMLEAGRHEGKKVAARTQPKDDPRAWDIYLRERIEGATISELLEIMAEFMLLGDPSGYNIHEQLLLWEAASRK